MRVVGYGSLMSALGLGRQLPAIRGACPVSLSTRRAFAKPSQRGGCLAMDVALPSATLDGARRGLDDPGPCEGLLLEVGAEESHALARREGYSRECWERLLAAAGRSLGAFLLGLAESAQHDVVAYRQALHEVAGPPTLQTSHYLPHPIRLDDGPAVIFVAPAPGETGIPGVDSAKAAFPRLRPASLVELFALPQGVYPPFDAALQGRYVELCLLAAAHGLFVGDLLSPLPDEHPVARTLRAWRRDPDPLREERAALRAVIGEDYPARFGPSLEGALERSGLLAYS